MLVSGLPGDWIKLFFTYLLTYDTQLYSSCSLAVTQLIQSINDFNLWMSSNWLKLNVDKTQYMQCGLSNMLEQYATTRCWRWSDPIRCSARPGRCTELKAAMKNHADGVIRSCFCQLLQLQCFCQSLKFDAAHTLFHISCRVYYCNAILVRVSIRIIWKLQSVQNAAARLVTGVCWKEHIMPTVGSVVYHKGLAANPLIHYTGFLYGSGSVIKLKR